MVARKKQQPSNKSKNPPVESIAVKNRKIFERVNKNPKILTEVDSLISKTKRARQYAEEITNNSKKKKKKNVKTKT